MIVFVVESGKIHGNRRDAIINNKKLVNFWENYYEFEIIEII